jgi:membrane protease YdiL (CAAX protease family)
LWLGNTLFFLCPDLQNTAKASLIPLLFAPFFGVFDFSAIKFILSSGFDDDEDSPVPLVAFLLISVGLDTFFVLLGFNTSNESTTIAYLMMIYGSFIALLFLKVFLGASEDEEPLAFDKNPGWNGILLALFLGFVVLIINVAVVSFASLSFVPSGIGTLQGIDYNSLLFVPKFFSVAQAGQQSVLDNAVFQLILTAPGEEGLKAAMLYGMYIVTKSEAISVGFSTAIWASFHTILVGFTLPEVALAFMSGLIWYGGWRYTGSLLVPIISHGCYDASIVALSGVH